MELRRILLATLVLGLAACGGGGGGGTPPSGGGGGGGGTTLHGVAAAGAPIVGTVTVKDSSTPPKTKTVLIAADGSYTVDVSGMTGPFALRADGVVGGRKYELYSPATSADVGGTINITPFTDLIVTNIARDIAASYYAAGDFSGLTEGEIAAAETALQEKLQPILTEVGLDASIDLLRTAFSANRTQLDGVLDILQVTIDPQTLTAEILNIVTSNSVSMGVATGTYTGAFTAADGTATAEGLTDLQKIVAGFDAFSALFATGLPADDDPRLLDLFDQANFLHDGMGLAQFLSDPTSDPALVGIQFTNVTVLSLDPAAGVARVGFDVVLGGVIMHDAPNRFRMARGGDGEWRMQGNQHLLRTHIEVTSRYWPAAGQFQTGFNFSVRDDGGASNVDYVVVRGPGLPADGVVLVRDPARDDFVLAEAVWPPVDHVDELPMDDATIDQIPAWGAGYAFTLWNANQTPGNRADDTQLDTAHAPYRLQLRARPHKLSELSAASFAAISAPSPTAWRAFGGGRVDVSWTVPAGCRSDYVHVYLWGPEGSAEGETVVAPAATSASLTVLAQTAQGAPITLESRNLSVGVMDDGGRSLTTHLY